MSMAMFNKGVLRLVRDQQQKLWQRHAGLDLEGRTVVIVGVGAIGKEIARVCRVLGMRTLGVKRRTEGVDPATLHLDELYAQEQLHEVLPRGQYLVLVAPHTPQTTGMIGAAELALLPDNALFINIARGALVDEAALVNALQSGNLGGASLDVFAQEPLDADSPLWHLPNVMISPHSASTTDRENHRLTDLFCENLRRYLAGDDLLNVLDTEQLY